jgi:hypothetical protein
MDELKISAREHLWRQGRVACRWHRAPRRQAPTVVPRDGQAIFIFFKNIFKTLLSFLKTTN